MATEQTNHQNCYGCKAETVTVREYPWYCVPKRKYNQEPHWTTFVVELCDACYAKTTKCDSVSGWDWWDAMDCLDYQYLKPQEYRDHYDASTSKLLGFASVDDLRRARENNKKVRFDKSVLIDLLKVNKDMLMEHHDFYCGHCINDTEPYPTITFFIDSENNIDKMRSLADSIFTKHMSIPSLFPYDIEVTGRIYAL